MVGSRSREQTRILLIEDNPGDARLIRETLSETVGNPFEVETVATLAEGLHCLDRTDSQVDVVLLDLFLPDSSGLDTLRAVQAAAPDMPVVVLTILEDEEIGAQAVQLGAQDYLGKGHVPGRTLARALRYAIEREQARQERRRLLQETQNALHEAQAAQNEARAAQGEARAAQGETQIALGRMQDLYDLSRRLSATRQTDKVLHIMASSRFLPTIQQASILIFDSPWARDHLPESFESLAVLNPRAWTPGPLGVRLPLSSHAFHVLFTLDQPGCVTDAATDPRFPPEAHRLAEAIGTRSLMSFPLVTGGSCYGMLVLHSPDAHALADGAIRHMQGLVDEAAVVIENIRLFAAEAEARRAAETADALKLRFLAMISHELRTPLTSIKGFATTLLSDDVTWTAEEQTDFVRIIDEESDKLRDLIEQLLDLSRLEAGTLRISPEPQSLRAVLDAAGTELLSLAGDHRLEVSVPPDLPPVLCDGQRVAQVLANLVDNASKYSPPGTHIGVVVRLDGPWVQVDVSDEGPGIAQAERHTIFNAFYRVEDAAARQTKGAGLGLAVCKGLIEAHGGHIWVQERDTPGAVLSFTLPLAVPPAA